MKHKIAIATHDAISANFYRKQLEDLFGGMVDFTLHSIEAPPLSNINADIVLVATHYLYEHVKKHVSNYNSIIIADLTLKKQALEKIMMIPDKTKAILANVNAEMAVDTIALIYQYGVTHVDFIPYYPAKDDIPNVDIAVTPGERVCVPATIDNIIDLGHRVLSVKTIVDIAMKLKMDDLLQSPTFQNYFDTLVGNNYGIENLLGKADLLEKRLDLLLQISDDGIIGVNSDGIIYFLNEAAEKIIRMKKEEVVGRYGEAIISDLSFREALTAKKIIKKRVIKYRGDYLVLSLYPIMSAHSAKDCIILIREFKETEKQQHNLRKQIIKNGHVAKYDFNDIIGQTAPIVYSKTTAQKMASSDSSILICGESGTGKELFAQAIHNSSKRRDYQFIAINCGAIPENLLESELFGYEEGAFTGAKKGGKLGYFELAHQGTLFLDEISELALNLQSRLLRVLQEKEVVRIGGESVISVDVRIIAATNNNLRQLVKKKQFREDLFYRLNVLPLNLPTLRERKEDIPLLLENFKKQMKADFNLSNEVMKKIHQYDWDGNIRELRNFTERLMYIGKKEIALNDMKMFLAETSDDISLSDTEKHLLESFQHRIWGNASKHLFIMSELEKSHYGKTRLGRRSLLKLAEENNIHITEQEIRNIVSELNLFKIVAISKGRGGTEITDFGLKALNTIRNEESIQ
jgi:transcriptional regulator with PAS, ATPase and Fis domain